MFMRPRKPPQSDPEAVNMQADRIRLQYLRARHSPPISIRWAGESVRQRSRCGVGLMNHDAVYAMACQIIRDSLTVHAATSQAAHSLLPGQTNRPRAVTFPCPYRQLKRLRGSAHRPVLHTTSIVSVSLLCAVAFLYCTRRLFVDR